MPGAGKTYHMIQLVKEMIAKRDRLLFVDTPGSIGRMNHLPFSHHTFTRVGELRDFFSVPRPKFRIVFKPGVEMEQDFDWICRYVKEVGDMVFAVDEVHWFTKPSHIPKFFKYLVLAGRHCGTNGGVSVLYTSQRPAECSLTLRSMTNAFKIFRLGSNADVEYFVKAEIPHALLLQSRTFPDRTYIDRPDIGLESKICRS